VADLNGVRTPAANDPDGIRAHTRRRHRTLEQNDVDRLAFPTCETHCETFVKSDDILTLYKPRCIIGVWALPTGESGLLIGAILT